MYSLLLLLLNFVVLKTYLKRKETHKHNHPFFNVIHFDFNQKMDNLFREKEKESKNTCNEWELPLLHAMSHLKIYSVCPFLKRFQTTNAHTHSFKRKRIKKI